MLFLNLQAAIDRAYRIANSDSPYAEDHKLIYQWLTEHSQLNKEINRLRSMLNTVINQSGCPVCGDPNCGSYTLEDWQNYYGINLND